MTLPVLRDDALRSTSGGFELLLSLPWIRSLPAESLRDVAVRLDGRDVDVVAHVPGDWWYLQDRVALRGSVPVAAGAHEVDVTFCLAIPYLAAGPDGPLALPFRDARTLVATGAGETAGATDAGSAALPPGWTLTASAFNWTPHVIHAASSAADIAVGVVRGGVAEAIEIEAGQVWRTFPEPAGAEVDGLRAALDAAGGRVSIVGASIDEWTLDGRRRSDEERLAFLVPQLRAAARVGAIGARVPLGQAGPGLLRLLQPTLDELDIVLFEEAQGHQTPQSSAQAYDEVAALDDPHIRVLLDISMLMPALPVTYLERLRAAGVSPELMRRIETEWRDPATHGAVVDLLRAGGVPGPVHTLYMNMLVRFGRTDAAELRDVLPLVSGVHLKFWDLDDADGRVSNPIRDIGRELRAAAFTGTLCSEWGGNEWLDDDPATMTRAHLALARSLLAG
ncbi:MAG TPA: restriction endonuclease subunit R [Microbacterium sp.]|nr:restriction endonuclease subunit R [Microbacterium sp.]